MTSPDPCSADDPLLPNGCPVRASRYVRVACVHEHVREGRLCSLHLAKMESAFCRICRDLGHDCELR